ncbi:MAG TPA: pantoate--beta-alanine ligase [Candidatus Brocadiia bacterium]|nr:pantoate--beta-alanine ligase [Candidatus Brocadiia bacterium]
MRIARTIAEAREAIAAARKAGKTVGFAPTMGALHEGHLSLMRRARKEHGLAVASIFVNPTQFGPSEDLNRYPRPFEKDCKLAEAAGVDLLFAPTPEVMYPAGYTVAVTEKELSRVLEGAVRPGHFDGVCTVCAKLFNIIQPDTSYFGQKDYQQAAIIRRMVRCLDIPMQVVVMPIVREPDGLAMSSRNVYLNPEERKQALCLSRALQAAVKAFDAGERRAGELKRVMSDIITRQPLAKPDYITVAHPDTLADLDRIETGAVALLAVRFGATRLLDNALLGSAS